MQLSLGIRTNYSRQRGLSVDLRGDKLGEYFRKMRVGFDTTKIDDIGSIVQHYLLNRQRGMAGTVDAGVTAVKIRVLLAGWRRAMM